MYFELCLVLLRLFCLFLAKADGPLNGRLAYMYIDIAPIIRECVNIRYEANRIRFGLFNKRYN